MQVLSHCQILSSLEFATQLQISALTEVSSNPSPSFW